MEDSRDDEEQRRQKLIGTMGAKKRMAKKSWKAEMRGS